MHLSRPRRVAIVAATGLLLWVLGDWITTSNPYEAWFYTPSGSPTYPDAMSPIQVLFMWIGFAGLWIFVSIRVLRSGRTHATARRANSQPNA